MTIQLGIVGGYLGAGKSTLINRLLAGVLPGRTGIVVNDFGSVNIDADLISSATEDTIEMTNGCICCQISDDVARTMSALAERRDLDQVLCEVSGVGDPRQLATWQRYPGFRPGPVTVCADSTAIQRLLRNQYVGDIVERQLASADVVLLTKTDLSGSDELNAATQACQQAAPSAQVVSQNSANPDVTARAIYTTAPDSPAGSVSYRGHGDAQQFGHAQTHKTVTIEDLRNVDVTAIAATLTSVSDRLVRAKGVVEDPHGRWHEVQLSSGTVNVRPFSPDRKEPQHSALTLIAVGPDALDALREASGRLAQAVRRT